MPLNRIPGQFSAADTHTPGQRPARLGVLILLVLLLIWAQYGQASVGVFRAAIPSWDDPDTDDPNNIPPPSAGDIDHASDRSCLTRASLTGSLKLSDTLGSDQSPGFSVVITRAPPATSSRRPDLAVSPSVALSATSSPVLIASTLSGFHAINPNPRERQ